MGNFLVSFFESDTIQQVLRGITQLLTGLNVTKIFVSLFTVSFVLYILRRLFWG